MQGFINGVIAVVAMVGFIYGIAYLNNHVNEVKETRCAQVGGTFVKNITDADQSTCIMKGK